MVSSLVYITISEWSLIILQVFGGCCSNMFVLESILLNNKPNTSLGTIITFSQFVFVSGVSYFLVADFRNGTCNRLYLPRTNVPLANWSWLVLMYFSVSLLNNLAWKFNISVPLNIIFRSSVTVISMLVGYCFAGKKYNFHQISSSVIISSGTIFATTPTNFRDGNVLSSIDPSFIVGVSILLVASVLSAFMGIYNEQLYKNYGNQWKESLFYSHFLGLPLFIVVWPSITAELKHVWYASPIIQLPGNFEISRQVCLLVVNVVSQYACIRGVNMLAGKTSALTVTIVLVLRKLFSLFISVVCFQNSIMIREAIGFGLVLVGTLQYSLANIKLIKLHPKKNV